MIDLKKFVLMLVLLCLSNVACSDRESRWLSLFNVVTFEQEACQGSSGLGGVCVTAGECAGRMGGGSDGGCAMGFGVCCVVNVNTCGATVTHNCTYVSNPGFPASFDQSGQCSFQIEQCGSNICSVRLDMETFSINGPDLNTLSGNCIDTFVATDALGRATPTICGENAGQHMYLNAGLNNNMPLSLDFNFNGMGQRRFRIKISQIECGTNYTPEPECLMYLTGLSGQVRSYNFDSPPNQYYHLANQNYEICLRQEEGYCRVAWTPSPDEFSFKLTGKLNPINGQDKARTGDQGCPVDFVIIPNGSNGMNVQCVSSMGVVSNTIDRYCGAKLNCINKALVNSQIVSDGFTIGVRFNGFDNNLPNNNRGFELDWRQLPCP